MGPRFYRIGLGRKALNLLEPKRVCMRFVFVIVATCLALLARGSAAAPFNAPLEDAAAAAPLARVLSDPSGASGANKSAADIAAENANQDAADQVRWGCFCWAH